MVRTPPFHGVNTGSNPVGVTNLQVIMQKSYLDSRLISILFLGFASGFPLALTASTLIVWLTEEKIAIEHVGLFAFTGLTYSLKFLWSPFIDGLKLPLLHNILGKRRSWLLLIQVLLLIAILALGLSDPKEHLFLCFGIAAVVAFLSASQDIVADAFRIEKLDEELQGLGATVFGLGYRIGAYASGAGLLLIATFYNWSLAYIIGAFAMGIGIVTTLLCHEPVHASTKDQPTKTATEFLQHVIFDPFKDFMLYRRWYLIILFVLLYKLGDAMAGIMTMPFLLNLGFTKPEIVAVVKTFGLFAGLSGSLIGGVVAYRIGIVKSLILCGVLQMLSNLMFVVQAHAGHDSFYLAMTIGCENLATGMGSVAMIAYLSNLCNAKFTATQYALLSSCATIARNMLSGATGYIIGSVGWVSFFYITVIAAIPGILIIFVIKDLKKNQPNRV